MENNITDQQIIEALLFSTPQALTTQQIKKITNIKSKDTQDIIKILNTFYEETKRAFYIEKVAGGFQIRTKKEYKIWINQVENIKPVRLSNSILETLSIVTYKQPITRSEVEMMRGVDSSYGIRSLLERDLIRIVGKKMDAGRPLLYGTSKKFLELFGFDSLNDLPKPEELDLPS